jgi:hypothetical protein
MKLTPQSPHPTGENPSPPANAHPSPITLDTYDGKLHIEWLPDAAVTPLGQLPFFIQFLKIGGQLDPWVNECPLHYSSNNAPEKLTYSDHYFYPYYPATNATPTSPHS